MPSPLGIDLSAFVSTERVLVIEQNLAKATLLARLIERTASHTHVSDAAAFTKAIYDREEVASTGIGGEVAVPHARLASIQGYVLSVGIIRYGIDYTAQDQKPVRVAVMIAASDDDHQRYLKVLASVAMRLKTPGLVDELSQLNDPHRIITTFLG